jgi:hypothetical protein
MNSQFLVAPGEKTFHLSNDIPIVQYNRTFMWLATSALVGVIFSGINQNIVNFFQRPFGMFLMIFVTLHASVQFNTSASVLLKLTISSAVYMLIVQLLVKLSNCAFPDVNDLHLLDDPNYKLFGNQQNEAINIKVIPKLKPHLFNRQED